MTLSIRTDRRDFLVKSAALTGSLTLGVRFPRLCAGSHVDSGGAGDHPLDRHPARRHRADPHRPLRTGAGQLHGPGDAGRRGAGMRLEQGSRRIRRRERARAAQPDLRFHVHGREPRNSRFSGVCAQRWRRRARDARRGCRTRLGRARVRVQRRQRRDHACAEQPQHDFRQGRCGRFAARGSKGAQAQGPEPVEADRHLAGALRHSRQDHRQADLHRRRAPARARARVHRAMPGVRRQGQELRRLQGQVHAWRQESSARRRLGRGRRGQLVARQSGAQAGVDRVGCGSRAAMCRASRSCSSCAPASRRKRRRWRARTAISTQPSPVPRRSSRPSTTRPT